MVVQVFMEYEIWKGCPSRSDMSGTGIVKGMQRCSDPRSRISQTALSPEKESADALARACKANTRYIGPHWTTTPENEVAKSTDACQTHCKGRRSCTKLLRTVTLRKKGGNWGSVVLRDLHR